jgi:hypothetical protein
LQSLFEKCLLNVFWQQKNQVINNLSNLFGLYNTFGKTCILISSLFNKFVINAYNVAYFNFLKLELLFVIP